MIYLDNAATTKPYPEVVDAVSFQLTKNYGNPSSLHRLGLNARKAVEHAREQVATYMGAKPAQIYFTSGGTEANNMVFEMLGNYLHKRGQMILTTKVEHESVLRAIVKTSVKYDVDYGYLDVTKDGEVIVNDDIVQLIKSGKVGLVSIMAVNNETGFSMVDRCPPKDTLLKRLKKLSPKGSLLTHTDCVQAAGYEDINVDLLGCDFMSMSAHKIHGIKGAGCLYIRNYSLEYSPLIIGGYEQERGLRGGTENVPSIVGFGKACEILTNDHERCASENWLSLNNLSASFKFELERGLRENGVQYTINSDTNKIMNVRFHGVDAETLVLMLASKGVCVSAGSACRSQESEPSYVLRAIGLTAEEARQSIRISFSADDKREELEMAANIITECVVRLLGKDKNDT